MVDGESGVKQKIIILLLDVVYDRPPRHSYEFHFSKTFEEGEKNPRCASASKSTRFLYHFDNLSSPSVLNLEIISILIKSLPILSHSVSLGPVLRPVSLPEFNYAVHPITDCFNDVLLPPLLIKDIPIRTR